MRRDLREQNNTCRGNNKYCCLKGLVINEERSPHPKCSGSRICREIRCIFDLVAFDRHEWLDVEIRNPDVGPLAAVIALYAVLDEYSPRLLLDDSQRKLCVIAEH